MLIDTLIGLEGSPLDEEAYDAVNQAFQRAAMAGSAVGVLGTPGRGWLGLGCLHGFVRGCTPTLALDDAQPARMIPLPPGTPDLLKIVGNGWVAGDREGGWMVAAGGVPRSVPFDQLVGGTTSALVLHPARGDRRPVTWLRPQGVHESEAPTSPPISDLQWLESASCFRVGPFPGPRRCWYPETGAIGSVPGPEVGEGVSWERTYTSGWRLEQHDGETVRVDPKGRRTTTSHRGIHTPPDLPRTLGPHGEFITNNPTAIDGRVEYGWVWPGKGPPKPLPHELTRRSTAYDAWSLGGRGAVLSDDLLAVLTATGAVESLYIMPTYPRSPRLVGWLGESHLLTSTGIVEIDPVPTPSLPGWFIAWLEDQPRAQVESPVEPPPDTPVVAEPLAEVPQDARAYADSWNVVTRGDGIETRRLVPSGVKGRHLSVEVPFTDLEESLIVLTSDLLFHPGGMTFLRRDGSLPPTSEPGGPAE